MSTGRTAGFFTHGVTADQYQLPHPLLGLPVILLVRRVLLRALELLREQGFQLAAASEDEVTAAIRSVIENNLRQTGSIAGFNKRTYNPVVRQGQWCNYNGAVLTKTPDLCFSLRDDEGPCRPVIPEFDALFIECKPVDATHAVGSKYCDDGLIRFVRGDYAWAMQEGMMLAYVRDGRTIARHLKPSMSELPRMSSLGTVQLPEPSSSPLASATSATEAVYVSRHRRAFPWPYGKGDATEITIYHLWPQCC
ncbi:MAG TPA: hypothetical protein VF614_09230 [Chthoniobacteraceae bacterium]|jgi:hypothetical protein